MKRGFTLIVSALLLMFAAVPVAADQNDATPEQGTAEATPSASGFEAGTWSLEGDDNHYLEIELTSIEGDDIDGDEVVEAWDPEDGTEDMNVEFEQELDAPEGCRFFEYVATDLPFFIALCSNDEFGLWAFGTEEDAVLYVAEQFADDDAELFPDGYEVVDDEDIDDADDVDDSNDDSDDDGEPAGIDADNGDDSDEDGD